eukprot:9165592-Karenia_brevis.AAC.1
MPQIKVPSSGPEVPRNGSVSRSAQKCACRGPRRYSDVPRNPHSQRSGGGGRSPACMRRFVTLCGLGSGQ